VVGGYLKSEAKVAADGMQALLYGAARVLAGAFDFTLVVAHCKESESPAHAITQTQFDPFLERPLGLDEEIAAALQARRYLEHSGACVEDLAEVSCRNHRDAMRNPLALRSGDFSAQQVLDAPSRVAPLTELMVAPRCDGACALLLASADRARAFAGCAVWIAGLGNATDAYWTARELGEAPALQAAAQRAFRMAGVSDPAKEIEVAEVSARFAHEELLFVRSLGLCEAGGDSRRWRTAMPVNPSGGALAGNPVTVAGLARAAESWLQLTGSAGKHQVEGAATALAHGVGGICGQNQGVVILRREPCAPRLE